MQMIMKTAMTMIPGHHQLWPHVLPPHHIMIGPPVRAAPPGSVTLLPFQTNRRRTEIHPPVRDRHSQQMR